jgi:hypothetical protein
MQASTYSTYFKSLVVFLPILGVSLFGSAALGTELKLEPQNTINQNQQTIGKSSTTTVSYCNFFLFLQKKC